MQKQKLKNKIKKLEGELRNLQNSVDRTKTEARNTDQLAQNVLNHLRDLAKMLKQ